MQDASVHINWRVFNIPSLVTVIVTAVGVVTYVNSLDARLATVEEYRVTRSAITDRKFDDIQTTLAPLANMPYRVGILEQQATAVNVRIDRFTEILTNTLELIRKDVNGLSTKIEVLSTKVDNLVPEKKAGLIGSPPELVR